MPLRDFNIHNGDLTITNGSVETDNIFDPEITITNRLKTLLYKTFFYENLFDEQFIGKRVHNSFEVEADIVDFCLSEIKRRYGNEYITYFVQIECLILDNTAYLFFYREDDTGSKVLLLDYELTL